MISFGHLGRIRQDNSSVVNRDVLPQGKGFPKLIDRAEQ